MVRDHARAARLGPVRSGRRLGKNRTERQALREFGVAKPMGKRRGRGLHARPAEGGICEAYRSRVSWSSGDCELRHFLEKSLLGGACAL